MQYSGYFLQCAEFFFNKAEFKFFLSNFSPSFLCKNDEPFRNQEIFTISLFSIVQIWVLKKLFLQLLVDILSFGFGSVDPHIFWGLDPGSQNLADPTDPTDPDPKHF